jgi:hypothetical protein
MIKLTEIEVSLCYDDPVKFEIHSHIESNNVDFLKDITSKKEIHEAFILECCSQILQDKGLPSLDKILIEHYPESQL